MVKTESDEDGGMCMPILRRLLDPPGPPQRRHPPRRVESLVGAVQETAERRPLRQPLRPRQFDHRTTCANRFDNAS